MEPMVVHYRLTVEAFRMGRAAALSVSNSRPLLLPQ